MKTNWTGSFIVLMLFLANSAHAILVDRILAVVNREPITLSDLNRYQAFIALNDGKKNWEAPPSPSSAALQQLIDRKLLLEEAEKFEIGLPKTNELLEAQDRFAKRFTNAEEFQNTLLRWGLDRDNLQHEIQDHLTVQRFVDQRITFFVIIPPLEIQKYYEAHREEYREKRPEEALALITKQLTDLKAREKLETYLKKLREKASIQINL
jgi:peptidyl-prolyl cis-trans isomerase SurA